MKRQLLLLAFMTLGLTAHAQSAGGLDLSFDPGAGANGKVNAIALQPDGKVMIGGAFSSFDGTAMNRIARLHADGTLDDSFSAGTGINGQTIAIVLQDDGKIIISGGLSSYNGTAVGGIARLNADGSLDQSFTTGTGADNWVPVTVLQPNGKIIVGGAFEEFNGVERRGVARLNADGTLDGTFSVGTVGSEGLGFDNSVSAIALQPDGKMMVCGLFGSYDGSTVKRIARLNANGTLDGSFTTGTGPNNDVYAVAVQPDGKILIGGDFTAYNGTARNRIVRLNADGILDGSFTVGTGFSGGGYPEVISIDVQPDGRIIIGGVFTSYNGTAMNYIARLNADGSLDESFTVGDGANGSVRTTVLQPDGKILIGGDFTSYDGTARNRIARLEGGVSSAVGSLADHGRYVYPNPGSGLFTLALGEASGTIHLTVSDITGREVLSEQFTATGSTVRTIDLSGRANGVYSLRIRTAEGVGGVRLVKE